MVRMSALRNQPVICQSRQIGLMQSISLDAARKRVCALVVSCGVRGKRVILPEQVIAMADGFILAHQAQKYSRSDERDMSSFVRDTTGLLVGRVTDYAVDERTLCVLAVEMSPGYWPKESGSRIWVYAYHGQEGGDLIVPASLGSERIASREGILRCEYPP